MKASHRREDFTAYQKVLQQPCARYSSSYIPGTQRRVHTGVIAKQLLHPSPQSEMTATVASVIDPTKTTAYIQFVLFSYSM